MKNNEWFRLRRYPHIGYPITLNNKKRVISYIKNEDKISQHSFFPFIHKQIFSKKIRKSYDDEGNILNGGKRQILDPKIRDIYYASHLDANIYSYYSSILGKKYNNLLITKNLDDVVTAYRKIRFDEHRNKCNIDFANEVFNYIRNNTPEHDSSSRLVAIAVDISGFFDNLDHQLLKQAWCNVLGVDKLPQDHYNVFRNITKFSYVEEFHLSKLFNENMIVKSKSGNISKKHVKRPKYMKSQGVIAFCDKNDIHKIRAKGLIRKDKYDSHGNLKDYGICQGSPISALLANMYMLPFDEKVNKEINKIGGLYRRYSDDIVVICDSSHKQLIIDFLEDSVKKISKLQIQSSKTQVFLFQYQHDKISCLQEWKGKTNKNSINRNFEYLGFSFDGEYTYLKTSSLARYYRKMKLSVRRAKHYRNRINNSSRGEIFRRRLYKQYSYIGAKRSKKYQRVAGTTNVWRQTSSYNWGNFITYAKLASKTLDNNKIDSQIKNHWKNLNNEINK